MRPFATVFVLEILLRATRDSEQASAANIHFPYTCSWLLYDPLQFKSLAGVERWGVWEAKPLHQNAPCLTTIPTLHKPSINQKLGSFPKPLGCGPRNKWPICSLALTVPTRPEQSFVRWRLGAWWAHRQHRIVFRTHPPKHLQFPRPRKAHRRSTSGLLQGLAYVGQQSSSPTFHSASFFHPVSLSVSHIPLFPILSPQSPNQGTVSGFPPSLLSFISTLSISLSLSFSHLPLFL